MPKYSYKCEKCGFTIERRMGFSEMEKYEKQMHICPKCKNKLKRFYDGNVNFIFKGEGFYVNDKNK
jgi:putative FmdB family regulatory protein